MFNVGQYRREAVKTYENFEFFKPENQEAMRIRRYKELGCGEAGLRGLLSLLSASGPAQLLPSRT